MNNLDKVRKSAFTLAEVLITLGVIGVVSAITIPTLINNYKEKETVTKLKVFYSKISQAYKMAINEYGSPEGWEILGSNNFEGAKNIYDKLSKYIKVIKNCGAETGCMADGKYHYKDGSNWMEFNSSSSLHEYKFITEDGFSVYIQTRDADCNESFGESDAVKNVGCALIGVDINGKTKPNTLGKDLFLFVMTKNDIIPRGRADFTTGGTFENNCLKTKVAWACSAWVIYNGNMDYLKCDDLNWETKTKCK